MKGYKAFDKDLKCRDFQYEIGQTYETDEEIECCIRGFHFCRNIADCYRFYKESEDTRICEVEAIGEIKTEGDIKYCTNKIKILSEVKNPKIKSNVSTTSSGYCNCGDWNNGNWNTGDCNTGNFNSGRRNSGHYNTGSWNSGIYNSGSWNKGDFNTGEFNTGDCNTGNYNSGRRNNGDFNSGDYNGGDYNFGNMNRGSWNSGNRNIGNRNSGNCNTGNCNSGEYNSGDYNSGNCNTGDWNSGNRNVGIFNCDTEPKIKIFDKESDWTMKDWQDSEAYKVMLACPCSDSDYDIGQEKTIVHKATEEDKQKWWDGLSEDDKNAVKSLPNFDADKFYICTGIKV